MGQYLHLGGHDIRNETVGRVVEDRESVFSPWKNIFSVKQIIVWILGEAYQIIVLKKNDPNIQDRERHSYDSQSKLKHDEPAVDGRIFCLCTVVEDCPNAN